jgi:Histone H1-like protein Hc1
MNHIEELKKLVEELEANYNKFEQKGNKAAATRATTGAMKVAKAAKEFRQFVLSEKQSA